MNQDRARDDVTRIFQHVLRAVDPERLVLDAISVAGGSMTVRGTEHALDPQGRVVLLGVGKSAIGMARGVETVLGDQLDHGVVVAKRGQVTAELGLRRTEVLEASHPVPDESSVAAGLRLLEEADALSANDVAIVVVSGGGSALVEAPVDGVSLADLKDATSVLLKGGSDIWTLNAVRRRLSRLKAGGLAQAIAPARVINLILSDVLGNPLGVIASGLSVEHDDGDRWRIDALHHTALWRALPDSVRDVLSAPADAASREPTVVQNEIVGDAASAARAALTAAADLGYEPFLLGTEFHGDAREFGHFWAQMSRSIATGKSSLSAPCCVVGAGEMTVTVRGGGQGGRNTEAASVASFDITDLAGVAIASLATDGDDGTSLAAGGVVTSEALDRARAHGAKPEELLAQNDSRAFLEAAGGLIVTGQTGTNVNDLYLALIVGTESDYGVS